MYFEITPKTRREDIFGREYLVENMLSHINDRDVRLIVIKGLRRTGKTSLLNVVLDETKQKKVKVDVRESPYYDRKEFMQYLSDKIKKEIGEPIFKRILSSISKVELSYNELAAAFYLNIEKDFLGFIETLDKQLKNNFLVLAFDEVQLLKNIEFDNVLAAIFDNHKNIKLILTGSEIGLVDEFLGKKDADSPLFGRAFIELEIKRLNNEDTAKFLTLGFSQIKKVISLEEIKNVIEVFDGIIGWAAYYGWLRSKKISHTKAISNVIEDGSKLEKKELDNFLEKRSKANYLSVLRWIAKGYNHWSLLESEFIKAGMKISDRQLGLYLQELIDYSFVEKIDKTYLITDPLLIRAIEIY